MYNKKGLEVACSTQREYDFCCVERNIKFEDVKENITYQDERLKLECGINCNNVFS